MDISKLMILSSNTVYIILIFLLVTFVVVLKEYFLIIKSKKLSEKLNLPPGPKRLPIIGNLISLDGYEVPYQAFNDLAIKYGPIINLKLGTIAAVVVNDIKNIKEVLLTKSSHFDSRPNFRRYHQLFCGDKENSLAFSDWSDVQKLRREMLVPHTFPKSFSPRFNVLNTIISNELTTLVDDITENCKKPIAIKPILLESSAKIFIKYLCSKDLSTKTNPKFLKMISNFDKIFYEVNQGYAADFLPFLLPLHRRNLGKLEKWSQEIRRFILENIIKDRMDQWICSDDEEGNYDYVDSLIDYVKKDLKPTMEWDTALFALEDMVGGHAAVGNFLVKVFGFVAQNIEIQKNIQNEIERVLKSRPNQEILLSDRNQMIYTEAVIMEALRLIASPIVPHVANQDSTIAGYDVKKDTLIFLNNYDLSMSEKLWIQPEIFEPKRFINSGRLVKPDFFLPFGAGRRSCMGYKMVQYISFTTVATIMKNFDIIPTEDFKVPLGSLAMPDKAFDFNFIPRI